MVKKRLFLALIAASMTFAACDKTESIPVDTPPTDNVDENANGENNNDGGENQDVDKLTPEQRAESNSIKGVISFVLSLIEKDQTEAITAIGDYTSAYADEIVLEGTTSTVISSLVSPAMSLINDHSAAAIVNFAKQVQSENKMKDLANLATAFGKSYLRLEASIDNESGETYTYFANLIDQEGVKIHANLYSVLDAIVSAAVIGYSEQFTNAYNAVYTLDTELNVNQISAENLKATLAGVSDIIDEAIKAKDGLKYFANFAISSLKKYANEVLKIDEELLTFIDKINTNKLLEVFFASLTLDSYLLDRTANSSDGTLDKIVSALNILPLLVPQKLRDLIDEFKAFIEHFSSDEFTALREQVVVKNGETKSVDETKLNCLIEDVYNAVNTLVLKKADAKAFVSEFVTEVTAKLEEQGLTSDQINSVVDEDKLNALVDDIFEPFEKIQEFLDAYLDPENHKYDEEISKLREILDKFVEGDNEGAMSDLIAFIQPFFTNESEASESELDPELLS